MSPTSAKSDHLSPADDNPTSATTNFNNLTRFKRAPIPNSSSTAANQHTPRRDRPRTITPSDRQGRPTRTHHHNRSLRKFLCPFRGSSLFYLCLLLGFLGFLLTSIKMPTSMTSVFRQGEGDRGSFLLDTFKFGSTLKFVPSPKFKLRGGLDRRGQTRIGLRSPTLGIVLGSMNKDPLSLMLVTVAKSLQSLGYILKIYAVKDGEARSLWETIVGQVPVLRPEKFAHIDWTRFEGIIADSLETESAISSLMQEPFSSVPLIWMIQDDTLASRLPVYAETGRSELISHWENAFHRADAVVFPDFSLPMLYSELDTGNFFVIPGSPIDVWAVENYDRARSRSKIREDNHVGDNDMMVLVVGSSFFYNKISWDYAVSMYNIGPLLTKYAKKDDAGMSFKFVFLCGNSSDDALQGIAARMGLHPGSLRHYSLNEDVNSMLLIADIVIYGSSQNEQGFPPLLTRAMTFGTPVIAPDYPVIEKYLVDGVHGMIFPRHNPEGLMRAFSRLISGGVLSKYGRTVGSAGKLLAKNMLASECIVGYAKLLETVLSFPSDVLLPSHISEFKQEWEWDLVSNLGELKDTYLRKSGAVVDLEENSAYVILSKNESRSDPDTVLADLPTEVEWDVLMEIENSEEVERVEMEEVEERMEKNYGEWDEIYRTARKAEKIKFESNERDEGELERTGQSLTIYEIYDGPGAYPFLHHGSLYRGLSLSTIARRSRSDDVDAVDRLSILNDTYYRDILCEMGGMFAVANRVDVIHKRPWIGFQSWRAAGRKVSLSAKAEQVLEDTLHEKTAGDVVYYWARLNSDGGLAFWSMCDIMNGGHCQSAFKDAFRQMYGLPAHAEALPPMPEDGGQWSALHSWVMPTPSFLEFVMFSRIFVDSLDSVRRSSKNASVCLLGFSKVEKNRCYCRMMEVLVNVWAYHSGRKMVYLNPNSGVLEEEHFVERRKGEMWAKYMNSSLLRSMDEDLAEAADDGDHPVYDKDDDDDDDDDGQWLWPLTGEVYWQGIFEREREDRYRVKMEKKRRTKEKQVERMIHGYRQKALGL